MSEDLRESARRPWKGGDFALPLFLFLPTAGVASIYGDRSLSLGIPGAELAQNAHVLMLACFIFIPLIFAVGRLAPWRHDIAVSVALLCVMFPPCLLSLGSVRVPLSRKMSHEELMTLHDRFKIPSLQTSDSGEGDLVRIRRSDYSEPVQAYIASLEVTNTGTPLPRK